MREIGYTKSDKLYDYHELMACPFCGKMPSMVVNSHRKQEVFFVKCMNKKCAVQPFTNEYNDILKAAKKWNKRADNGKGQASEHYKPTKGDAVRNMTDRQLAVWMDEHERDAYRAGKGGGSWQTGEPNIKFYTGYFGSAEGEDYNG